MIVQLCEACIDTDIDLNYVSSDFMKPAHKWQFSLLKFDIQYSNGDFVTDLQQCEVGGGSGWKGQQGGEEGQEGVGG